MDKMLVARYIDTCSPDYLTDHFNREGQYLSSTPADSDFYNSKEEVVKALLEDAICFGECLWDFNDDDIKEALEVALENIPLDLLTFDVPVSGPLEDEQFIYVLIEVSELDSSCVE